MIGINIHNFIHDIIIIHFYLYLCIIAGRLSIFLCKYIKLTKIFQRFKFIIIKFVNYAYIIEFKYVKFILLKK